MSSPLVIPFIGLLLETILYGVHPLITTCGSDNWTPSHRCLLSDIRLILANPTQESRSMERRTPLRTHCYFNSLHGVLRPYRSPDLAFHRSESDIVHMLMAPNHPERHSDGQKRRRSFTVGPFGMADRRSWRTIYRHRLNFTINIGVCNSYNLASTHVFFFPFKWSYTDVGSCGANHWFWLSQAFSHLRFKVLIYKKIKWFLA